MSDSPTAVTGYATVTKEVLRRLTQRGYEVAAIGWGYEGWPYSRNTIPYTIYPSQGQPFGRDSLSRALNHFRPDILVSLSDPWMVDWVRSTRELDAFRWLAYVTIDGDPLPAAWKSILRATDATVACSRFGQQVASQACPELDIDMIYHGVDLHAFRPLPDRTQLRQRQQLDDRFVVGCVARNQPRKHLPVLLQAFAKFCQKHDDAFLYLHTDPDDIGWDIRALLRRYKIASRTAISRNAAIDCGVTSARLNEIYNLFDLFVLPTASEGFGLPIMEAMAAGVPAVVTEHSACIELVEGRGELIPVKSSLTVGHYGVEQALPDTDALADIMENLYHNPQARSDYREAGLKFAATFNWETITDSWEKKLQTLHEAGWSRPPRIHTTIEPVKYDSLAIESVPDLETPRSLFVSALPYSLSTQVYHLSRQALGLRQPSWTGDGEILNTERFSFPATGGADIPREYVRQRTPGRLLEHGCDFLDEVVQPIGYAYKDALQPYVVAHWISHTDMRVLKIVRPLEDIAWAMLAQDKSPLTVDSQIQRTRLIKNLVEASTILEKIPGVILDWDELVTDELALTRALNELYKNCTIAPIRFHDQAFLDKRDQVLARRNRRDYAELHILVKEYRDRRQLVV